MCYVEPHRVFNAICRRRYVARGGGRGGLISWATSDFPFPLSLSLTLYYPPMRPLAIIRAYRITTYSHSLPSSPTQNSISFPRDRRQTFIREHAFLRPPRFSIASRFFFRIRSIIDLRKIPPLPGIIIENSVSLI